MNGGRASKDIWKKSNGQSFSKSDENYKSMYFTEHNQKQEENYTKGHCDRISKMRDKEKIFKSSQEKQTLCADDLRSYFS